MRNVGINGFGRFCTLEKSAVNLLDSVNKNNFAVTYTVIPYTEVSMIDFRFRVKSKISKKDFIEDLEHETINGSLHGLYAIDDLDVGPEKYNCTTFSSVFIKENIKVVNNQVYLPAYFDNENSVNRYYDLVEYISKY
jgi:glyceraldehyde 3-phosphate dehydrogenase